MKELEILKIIVMLAVWFSIIVSVVLLFTTDFSGWAVAYTVFSSVIGSYALAYIKSHT